MIKKIQSTKLQCTCDVCGFEWTAQSDTPPKVCGKCKSYNWNKSESKRSV